MFALNEAVTALNNGENVPASPDYEGEEAVECDRLSRVLHDSYRNESEAEGSVHHLPFEPRLVVLVVEILVEPPYIDGEVPLLKPPYPILP